MQDQVGLNMVLWHDLDMRCTEMPNQLEAMKIGEVSRMNLRHVAAVILLATFIGALASWGSVLTCYYQYGAATAKVNDWRTSMGSVPWKQLKDVLDNPVKADLPRMQGVGLGFIVTGVLIMLRQRFAWWPFHPIGYAIAGTATMEWLWCATLLGWLIKLADRALRRHEVVQAVHPILHRPDSRRLHHGQRVGHLRQPPGHPNLPRLSYLSLPLRLNSGSIFIEDFGFIVQVMPCRDFCILCHQNVIPSGGTAALHIQKYAVLLHSRQFRRLCLVEN